MNSPLIDRFRESMILNHDRWHDGVGYDLTLFGEATAQELEQIESLLVSRGIDDWRDVEALAALDTSRARDALHDAFRTGDANKRALIIAHAPSHFGEEERTDAIVAALENESPANQLTQIMLQVMDYHPPRVIQALLRGVCKRDAITASEFAMMLLFIHGQAESPWDMTLRPFIHRFQAEDRESLFFELCQRIGGEL